MDMPFTKEQFFEMLGAYNTAVWPGQIVAYVLAVVCVALALKKTRYSKAVISGALALFWLWGGAIFHIGYLSSINTAAYVFGAFFVLQGAFFFTGRLSFRPGLDLPGVTGAVLILYATVAYPLIGYAFGHGHPYSPAFGTAPCPTTIFTLGFLLWTATKVPKIFLVIPLAWSVIGATVVVFGVYEDIGLLAAGVISAAILFIRDRTRRDETTQG